MVCSILFILTTFAASLSGFQHGYNSAVMNNISEVTRKWLAKLFMNNKDKDNAVDFFFMMIVTLPSIGAVVGSSFSGRYADKWGRKYTLIYNNVIVFVFCTCTGLAVNAESIELFLFGRFMTGINLGVNSGVGPMYLVEISTKNIRGYVGCMYQLGIVCSILVVQVLGSKEFMGDEEMWQYLFLLPVIPSIIQIAMLSISPESPKYLLTKKDEEGAREGISWLYGMKYFDSVMNEFKSETDNEDNQNTIKCKDLAINPQVAKPIGVGIMIMIGQQLSGINVIRFDPSSLFGSLLPSHLIQKATLGIGVVIVVATLMSVTLIERTGRKEFLSLGFLGMTITTLPLMLFLIFGKKNHTAKILACGLVYMFVAFYAIGPGLVPWSYVHELFYPNSQGIATGLITSSNWGANMVFDMLYPSLHSVMGYWALIFLVVAQPSFYYYVKKHVPETKGKTITEIVDMFK